MQNKHAFSINKGGHKKLMNADNVSAIRFSSNGKAFYFGRKLCPEGEIVRTTLFEGWSE